MFIILLLLYMFLSAYKTLTFKLVEGVIKQKRKITSLCIWSIENVLFTKYTHLD